MSRLLSEYDKYVSERLLLDHFDRANWSVGRQPTIVKEGNDLVLRALPIHADLSVVTTDLELQQAKTVSFAKIFNTWKRVSVVGNNPHGLVSEEDAWTYDAQTDSVTCTVNSATSIGFISDKQYDNYTFEVEFLSTNGDDDSMGLMLAYEEVDGNCYSLMLFRTGSTVAPLMGASPIPPFYLVYQGWRSETWNERPGDRDPTAYMVGGVVGNLTFCDGTPVPAAGISTNGGHAGWNVYGKMRIKVVRTPTSIQCFTTNYNDLTYQAQNSFTVDLNSDARLKRFQSPKAIGYLAHSQPATSYTALQQPGLNTPIYDVRDKSVWLYQNGAWVKSSGLAGKNLIYPGQQVRSDVTSKLYFANADLSLSVIGDYS